MHVPDGWKTHNLSDLIEIHYGKSPVEVKDVMGRYPIIGTGGITGKANKYLCERSAIVIGRKGTINKPILITVPFWPIDTTFYCLSKEDTNLVWLLGLLKQLRLERFNESTGLPSLSRENLYSLKIQTPPLSEQQKIAQILSTWDKAIEKMEVLIAAKQKRKKALMQQLLTGKKRVKVAEVV